MTLTTVSTTVLYCDNCDGVLGDFVGGANLFCRTPLGMQWPSIYVVWWKYSGGILNTLATTKSQKRNVYAARVTFHSCAVLTPWTHYYPVVHVRSDGRHNHSCTISTQSVQGLGSYGTPDSPIFAQRSWSSWPLQTVIALPWCALIDYLWFAVLSNTLGFSGCNENEFVWFKSCIYWVKKLMRHSLLYS